jgi:ABC-type phosphate transport system substrate-binding protein
MLLKVALGREGIERNGSPYNLCARNKVMKTIAYVLLFAALVAICTPLFAGKAEVIHIKGSDTMIIVAQAWSEAYERVNSEVVISVGGGGGWCWYRCIA